MRIIRHQGVLVLPLNSSSSPPPRTRKQITVRPIKDSALDALGTILVQEDWTFLDPAQSASSLVQSFQDHFSSLVDHHFPLKTVTISNYDKPFFTENLRDKGNIDALEDQINT